MIVVAQTVWIGSALLLAGWLSWLATRAHGDRERIEDVVDRLDQLIHALQNATGPEPRPVMTAVERPMPVAGPPTVPTGRAIDSWHEHEIAEHGRHARREQ